MKKYIVRFLILINGLVLSFLAHTEPLVSYRVWQFHELDTSYVSQTMKFASQYDINTVVFSHGMIKETSQLHDGTDRAAKLKSLAHQAHTHNLRVWIWVHELHNVPDRFLEDGVVQLDRSGVWEWLEARYESVFKGFPEFDGLVLTFHETQYRMFSDKHVHSRLSKPDRFAKLIGTLYKVCKRYKKELVVRTFFYEPVELQWVQEGLLKSDPEVIVQSKCVPHDWEPYYPHNPVIGAFPNNRQIVEFDCSSEFTGKNRIPYASPEYFEYRWRYDLDQKNVVGYNARLDHNGYDAIQTPNQINLYAMYRFTESDTVSAADIWKEWTELQYGPDAAPFVQKALAPAFHVINKSFFPLHFWITNHSRLPNYRYADSHISSRTLAKWFPENPVYPQTEYQLRHPDPVILEQILAEKDTAIALAEESLLALRYAKSYLSADDYDDLDWRLNLLHRTSLIWKYHAEAFFGYKVLDEGYEVPGLKERVQRAVHALFLQADISEKDPCIQNYPPASASEIRVAAEELQQKLKIFDSE